MLPHLSSKLLGPVVSLFVLAGIAGAQEVPRSSHVWVINEENHGYNDVVGNPAMPYYNQLASEYGLATQFYSDQHSSLPALMWFVAGAPVETNEDTTSCDHTADNVIRELLRRGYTWKAYEEALPYAGFQGLYSSDDLYYRRHDPPIDFSDVCPGTGQDTNVVPFTQMATDFAAGHMVNFAWVTPDVNDDAHNGTLQAADAWLQANVPTILGRPEFQPGGDGILFIVFDESDLSGDNSCSATVSQGCGGHTATLVIGPRVKPGYQSAILYHNENVLATVCATMGLYPCPGAAETAAPMADFFTSEEAGAPANSIAVANPLSGTTVAGEVHLVASASESEPVFQMQVWDNGVKLGWYPGDRVDAIYKLQVGSHATTVLDETALGQVFRRSQMNYNVQPPPAGVQIVAPLPNESIVASTVHIVAQATEPVQVSQMQVWDNGRKLGWFPGSSVNQYFALPAGTHALSVVDLDSRYHVLHQTTVSYTVQ